MIPHADAGKPCSGKRDCIGQCLADGQVAAGAAVTGTCQRDIGQDVGCRQRIEGGRALGTACVD